MEWAALAAQFLGDAAGGSAASPGIVSAAANPNVNFGDFNGGQDGNSQLIQLAVIMVGIALIVRTVTK